MADTNDSMESDRDADDDSHHSEFDIPVYSAGDDALEDKLAMEMVGTPDGLQMRPSLADDQKIGFFSLDRATQTDITEIMPIKEMTNVVQGLLEEANTMSRDVKYIHQVLYADFEYNLQAKSVELYVRINEKIAVIEKVHNDRVLVMRRAFRQQLADALVKIQHRWEEVTRRRLAVERRKTQGVDGEMGRKAEDLQMIIMQRDGVIQMLKLQIEQFEEREDVKQWAEDEEDGDEDGEEGKREDGEGKTASPADNEASAAEQPAGSTPVDVAREEGTTPVTPARSARSSASRKSRKPTTAELEDVAQLTDKFSTLEKTNEMLRHNISKKDEKLLDLGLNLQEVEAILVLEKETVQKQAQELENERNELKKYVSEVRTSREQNTLQSIEMFAAAAVSSNSDVDQFLSGAMISYSTLLSQLNDQRRELTKEMEEKIEVAKTEAAREATEAAMHHWDKMGRRSPEAASRGSTVPSEGLGARSARSSRRERSAPRSRSPAPRRSPSGVQSRSPAGPVSTSASRRPVIAELSLPSDIANDSKTTRKQTILSDSSSIPKSKARTAPPSPPPTDFKSPAPHAAQSDPFTTEKKVKRAAAIDDSTIESLRKSESQLQNDVLRMKTEIERVHRMWEKKFTILQQSLHALKDESYLRQALQRQAVQMHTASVSFACKPHVCDSHPGLGTARVHPLPAIGKAGYERLSTHDYIAYAVGSSDGHVTARRYDVDEHQILGSDEYHYLPPDVIALPPPPEIGADRYSHDVPSSPPPTVMMPSM